CGAGGGKMLPHGGSSGTASSATPLARTWRDSAHAGSRGARRGAVHDRRKRPTARCGPGPRRHGRRRMGRTSFLPSGRPSPLPDPARAYDLRKPKEFTPHEGTINVDFSGPHILIGALGRVILNTHRFWAPARLAQRATSSTSRSTTGGGCCF